MTNQTTQKKQQKRRFKSPTISQQILLGFVVLIIISIVITAYNVVGMRDFKKQFSQFQDVSNHTELMLKVDKDISELQRSILAFSNTEKSTTFSQIISTHKQLLEDINILISSQALQQPKQKQRLIKIQTSIESLKENIDSLKISRDFRQQLINQYLENQFAELNEKMSGFFTSLKPSDNTQLLLEIWRVHQLISNAETLNNRYFSKHEFRVKKQLSYNLKDAEQGLKTMHGLIDNQESSIILEEIIDLLSNLTLTFNRAVQADRSFLFLVNVVIAGESSELSHLSDQLKKDYLSQQEALVSKTQTYIDKSEQISITVSIFGAIIAMLLAILLGKKISRPLLLITDTFNNLIKGEIIEEIPGANRTDEIGQLAKAANIFKENNAQTQQLLIQAEDATEELKAREFALKLAVEKAQEANNAKSQFLANMSHELRTPMNAILGMLTLLKRTELNANQHNYTNKTEGAARSLLGLLNDILDISKAEAGRIDLDPIPFKLTHLIKDLDVILTTQLSKKSIELKFNIQQGMPEYFIGDEMRLQQILINLGGNAIKFTEKGSVTVMVDAKTNDQNVYQVTFRVFDSGIGISQENQQKIFEGFTQAEASTTRRFGGTGLGLAISQKLVSLMGGQLLVKSQIDKGSCFYFTVELARPSQQQVENIYSQLLEKSSEQETERLSQLKILVVEDNLVNQHVARELLEAEAAIVEVVNHGQEALDALRKDIEKTGNNQVSYDLVLMDLQMPIMDGLTATKAIREQLALKDLPIIAMTANVMKEEREKCFQVGMNQHLGKPFDIDQVVDAIHRLLSVKN